MKMIRFVLVAAMICNITSCHAQGEKKVTDKVFQELLDKFRRVSPPLNYRKITQRIPSMTKEEAIQFLHKTEDELYSIEIDYGYDTDEKSYYKEEHTAGCDFKYLLNDSIFILCTREAIDNNSKTLVLLNSFSLQGQRIDKCTVGEQFTYESDWVSFVLLDKKHIRVFYYEDNDTREKEGYHSTVYYVNYKITDDGKFIEKDKSGITYLKSGVVRYRQYGSYNPKSDDPMNEYDF